MAIIIKVPTLPQSANTAKVSKFYKNAGDSVDFGERLVDLQIDTKTLSIRSPRSGIVDHYFVDLEGEVVANDQLVRIKDGLPELDRDEQSTIDSQYVLSKEQITASTMLAVQQLLAEKAGKYGIRVQTLPVKWEAGMHANLESGMHKNNGLLSHPAFANKSWGAREEERRHPSDLSEENVADNSLRYNPNYQPQFGFHPTPSVS